jgi:hypothetical protein
VNGGIFILIPFAWLVFLCFKSLASNFKESNSYNPEKVTIFAGWLGYLSQSLISVNQISLAVVGWSLTGVIIGNSKYYLQAIREVDDEIQSQKQFRWKVRVQSGIVAIILCLIAVPPFVQDFKFKKALSSGSAEKLSNASLFWPRNIYYLNMGSQLLRQNNLQEMAIVLSRMSVKINDRNIAGYLEIISNSSISEEEKLATLRHIRSLDPFSNLYVAVD